MGEQRPSVSLADYTARLVRVLTPIGIAASNDRLFRGAVFGRDSARVALDLVAWFPEISELAITSLTSLQGVTRDPVTEEEPGRIHHEYRTRWIGSRMIDEPQAALLKRLAANWGGTDDEVRYYGSADATPQFLRLLRAHTAAHGPQVLQLRVLHHSGSVRTVGEAAQDATRWVLRRISRSSVGLLEFRRSNREHGLRHQVWRDGGTAWLHQDGTRANADDWMATLELQGLGVDGLDAACELLADLNPDLSDKAREGADKLTQATSDTFAFEVGGIPASAVDIGPDGKVRHLVTATSVPAELLDSGVFARLDPDLAGGVLESIVAAAFSPDLLTNAGLRCRGVSEARLVPYWDYHGTHSVWVMPNNVIALGLRRQGFPRLASALEGRILHALACANEAYEFFYVDSDGRVCYRPLDLRTALETEADVEKVVVGTNVPERDQAWTLSAAISILKRAEQGGIYAQESWKSELEEKILAGLPQLPPCPEHLAVWSVDTSVGAEAERAFKAQL